MMIRSSRRPRVSFTIALILLFTGPALHAETKTFDPLDLLRALKVAPNTEAIATRQSYVLHGIQTGATDAKPQAGDTVTALVELSSFNGRLRPTQWIIRLQLAAKTPADSPQGKASDVTQYTNTGETFTFHSEQTGMKLETLGPIKVAAQPDLSVPVKRQEIVAATDFLSLDLNRTAQVIWRMTGQPHENTGLSLSTGSKPFPADVVNLQRPRAAALNLTSNDLRSFSGSTLALEQFLGIVRNTPDLQDILFQILDKPSLIDVFRSGARNSLNFDFLLGGGNFNGQEIFWPGTKHEEFGGLMFNLVIFKKPVLTVMLFITTPRPPLLLTAGIVGIVAFKPNPDNSDKIVVVRVLSATAGIPRADPKP